MTIEGGNTANATISGKSIKPKRNRIQLSCTQCRHAKLKCDRERPCSQCVKRERAAACVFPPAVERKKPAISLQNRLKHLESLVKGAMPDTVAAELITPETKPESPSSLDPTNAQNDVQINDSSASATDRVVSGSNAPTYVGATHWAAMLDDIEAVKTYLNEPDEMIAPVDENTGPDISTLLNSSAPSTTLDEVLTALPEQNVVNRLVSRYFNSHSPGMHIIHKPTFQKKYKKFWMNSKNFPPSFVGMIYAIMSLGAFAALGAGEENVYASSTAMDTIRTYRRYCTQCLAMSNYIKRPGPYTLETFLLYMEGELILSKGEQAGCYLIIGVAVRLALRMGFHRDSDNIKSSLTPYQGEMRRRIWHLLVQMDLLVSFHNGLPSMVQAVKSDTKVPSNLLDHDFDEDSTTLPESRPETEMTGLSYTLAKGRLARVFGKIVEQANLLSLPDYAEVVALEGELQEARSTIPPFLQPAPLNLCITDSVELIIRRISLDVLFQKSRCILHRKFLTESRENREYMKSEEAAIESSLELLKIQVEVHDASQPGGILYKDSWFISSLAMHDLLVAAAIVYLHLIQIGKQFASITSIRAMPDARQKELIVALETSCRIWSEIRSLSLDTNKAYEVLCVMVQRLKVLKLCNELNNEEYTSEDRESIRSNTHPSIATLSMNESELSGMTLSRPRDFSGGEEFGKIVPEFSMQPDFDIGFTSNEFLGAFNEDVMDFDWTLFDNHIRQTQPEETWLEFSIENLDTEGENNYGIE